jgi:hypothetical protein
MYGFKYIYLLLFILIASGSSCQRKPSVGERDTVDQFINTWHRDVAELREEDYFDKMSDGFVFVGTDPSEVWNKEEFRKFSHPYFVKGKTWDFRPISRNIYFSEKAKFAWFDELLDTWMGLCRGSGVLVYEENSWRLQHYVLSVTVPNEDMEAVLQIKKLRDSLYVSSHITGSSGL